MGEVSFVSNPAPVYNPVAMLAPKTSIDIKVVAAGKEYEFNQLPGDMSVFSYGPNSAVVSDSKEAIISEITAYRDQKQQAVDEHDTNVMIVNDCNAALRELNPQLKKEAEQAEKIEMLERRFDKLESMLAKALGQDSSKNE